MSVRRHSCGARRQVVCGASQPIVGDGPQPFRRIKRRRRLQTGVQQAAAVNCMSRTYVTFGDIVGKLHVLRPECTRCARKGRYSRPMSTIGTLRRIAATHQFGRYRRHSGHAAKSSGASIRRFFLTHSRSKRKRAKLTRRSAPSPSPRRGGRGGPASGRPKRAKPGARGILGTSDKQIARCVAVALQPNHLCS
jgi:hypothetical protein